MTRPDYCSSQIYQVLESICKMLNTCVCYGDTPNNSLAIAEVDSYPPYIVMSETRISSKNYAARTLGHEIGHFLVERFYVESGINDLDASYLIELQCDQIGNALYLLAKSIVEEAQAEGVPLATSINRAISETMERDGGAGTTEQQNRNGLTSIPETL